MSAEMEIKRQVRDFYDSVGWKEIAEGLYQNARYEDLRPVMREYVHRCHQRLKRHLSSRGGLFLDAGSGPIQYPEYLEYAAEFRYRVCLDISEVALREARRRIGARGLFVVGDVTRIPFKPSAFDSLTSLHTIHHLQLSEQESGIRELARVLADSGRGVIVYSWGEHSHLMRLARLPIAIALALRRSLAGEMSRQGEASGDLTANRSVRAELIGRPGTFTFHHDYRWASANLSDLPGFEIRVWRSVSTAFTRALVYRALLGRLWLVVLFRLEDLAPHWFGRMGQYPMFLIHKLPGHPGAGEERRA